MSITAVTKTSQETSKNLYDSGRAVLNQTAGKVSSFLLSHKSDVFVSTLALFWVTVAASIVYQQYTDVWPHQVLIANIIYPFRNIVSDDWKTSIEEYNSECYPAAKFTEEDRKELQDWVNASEDDYIKLDRETMMEKVLEGKKDLFNSPKSIINLKVFDKLSHVHIIAFKSKEKVDLPKKLQSLKNLRFLTLENFTIPADYKWENFSKLGSLLFKECDIPNDLNYGSNRLLKFLEFTKCKLAEFPKIELPEEYPLLRILTIRECSIAELPVEMPKEVEKLSNLDLSGNLLTSLPAWIGKLQKLDFLDLSGNDKLKELPEEIYQLPKTCRIRIDSSAIALVPIFEKVTEEGYSGPKFFLARDNFFSSSDYSSVDDLQKIAKSFKAEDLRELDEWVQENEDNVSARIDFRNEILMKKWLDHELASESDAENQAFVNIAIRFLKKHDAITSLSLHNKRDTPLQIDLQNLKISRSSGSFFGSSLSLTGFNIENLESVGNLKDLAEISLKNCGIEQLPDTFQNLLSLKELDLRNTNIKTVPAWIKDLRSLKTLWLSDNEQLTELPEEIYQLPEECSVRLFHNKGITSENLTKIRQRISASGYVGPKILLPGE